MPKTNPNQPPPSDEGTPATAPAAGKGMPAKDLKRGLSDTSKGAETDKAYQKQK